MEKRETLQASPSPSPSASGRENGLKAVDSIQLRREPGLGTPFPMGLLLNCAYLVIFIGAHGLSGALRQLRGLSIGSTAGAEERDDLPHPYSFMNQTIK